MSSAARQRKTQEQELPATVTLRRSARARRITLRVSSLDGTVSVTVPRHVPEAAAMAFVAERRDWVRAQIARVPQARQVMLGDVVSIAGAIHTVAARGAGAGERLIPVRPDRPVGPQVRAFVIDAARAHFDEAVARHAARLGRAPGRIALRDTRSRWGSCSSEGNLMFSWRLVLAPVNVSDYVAAHEVAHLAHMDHSPAFWAEVARLFPGHAAARRWLRAEGASLHGWRFGP